MQCLKVYAVYSGRLVVSKYTNDDLIIMCYIQTVNFCQYYCAIADLIVVDYCIEPVKHYCGCMIMRISRARIYRGAQYQIKISARANHVIRNSWARLPDNHASTDYRL